VCLQQDSSNTEREFTMQTKPPNIEWHLARKIEEFELMAVSAAASLCVYVCVCVCVCCFFLFCWVMGVCLLTEPHHCSFKPNLWTLSGFWLPRLKGLLTGKLIAVNFWLLPCDGSVFGLNPQHYTSCLACLLSRLTACFCVIRWWSQKNGKHQEILHAWATH
jgi:hypothetical protein